MRKLAQLLSALLEAYSHCLADGLNITPRPLTSSVGDIIDGQERVVK